MKNTSKLVNPKIGIFFLVIYVFIALYNIFTADSAYNIGWEFKYRFERALVKYILGPIIAFLVGWSVDFVKTIKEKEFTAIKTGNFTTPAREAAQEKIDSINTRSRAIAITLLQVLILLNLLVLFIGKDICSSGFIVSACVVLIPIIAPIGYFTPMFFMSFFKTHDDIVFYGRRAAILLIISLLIIIFVVYQENSIKQRRSAYPQRSCPIAVIQKSFL